MKLKKIAAVVLAAAVLTATPAAVTLFNPFSVTANAADALTEGDYEYSVNEDGETVTITKYTGNDAEVEIPGSLGGKTVTEIGEEAFYYCEFLTSVTIPQNVTKIGKNAFCGCTSLLSVTIPDSVTIIGDGAFQICISLISVTIPENVTRIEQHAFDECRSLTSVTIPDSVTFMSGVPFCGCTSLEEITVGENNATYSSIDGVVFNKDKTELLYYPPGKKAISYTIPDSVTVIGRNAFRYCISLTSVTIPDDVTEIDIDAFYECTSLTSITIPDGVTEIGEGAFYHCTSLTSIVIPDGVTRVSFASFQDCTSLTNVIIPNSVSKIENWAFLGCSSLASVAIPDSVTTIGENAFFCCSLTSITIPDNLTTIGNGAFVCPSLREITIGENNKNYSLIDGVLFNKDVTELVCYPAGKKEILYVVPDRVTIIGNMAFGGSASLTNVTIPVSVTTIDCDAFAGCTSLEMVNYGGNKAEWEAIEIKDGNECLTNAEIICTDGIINERKEPQPGDTFVDGDLKYKVLEDDTLEVIGFASDELKETIEELIIPEEVDGKSVTDIGSEAFCNCISITSVTIPNGVTSLSGSFNTCTSLISVAIPNSVTYISTTAFFGCTSLITIDYDGTKAEWAEVLIFNDFTPNPIANVEIICTDGIINEREPDTSDPDTSDTSEPEESDTNEPETSDTSEPTTSDTHEPTVPDTGEPETSDTSDPEALKPGDYFVDGGLEYTVLKDGTLEVRGFADSEAAELVIPETVKGKKVTSVGDAAFIDCTTLTSVTIPSSVTRIGGYAFYGCTSLDTVNYDGRKSEWEAIDIDIENDPLTNAEIKFAEATVEIVDEDTNVKVEISTEDKELDGAEFEVDPADHPTLLDLIKKIIEKVIDTAESITEDVQKSLDEAAEAVKNGNGFAYDMGFKKDGKEVQPDRTVTVTVPVPEKFKGDIDRLNVYHLTSRGAVYVPSWIKDGSIVFKTDSFSPYVITVEKLANAVVDENENPTPGGSDNNSDGNGGNNGDASGTPNPPTGIALSIAPAALAAGAVIVFFKKRK